MASKIRVDFSFEAFFPKWDLNRPTFDEYKTIFPKEDAQFALFWIEEGPMGLEQFDGLSAAANIFSDAGLESVDWIGSVDVATQRMIENELTLSIEPLIAQSGLGQRTLDAALAQYRDDPLYNGVIWNQDQDVFVLHGFIPSAENNDEGRRNIENRITTQLASLEKEGRTLILTGLPVIRARAVDLLSKDQAIFLGGGLILSFAVLFLVFRSYRHTFLCLASIIPGYLSAVALMAAMGKPITVMTSVMPTIVLVVLLSDTVHLVLQFRLNLDRGLAQSEAISRSFAELLTPCFYTSLTTAIGFLSLIGTGIDVMVDLGMFTAAAIMIGFAFNMVLLPALISFPTNESLKSLIVNRRPSEHIIDIAKLSTRLPPFLVVAAFAVIGLAAATMTNQLRVNTKMFDDVRDTHPLKQDVIAVEDRGFSLFTLNLYIRKSGSAELYDVRVLEWIDRFQAKMADESIVLKTFAMTDHIKQIRQAVFDGSPKEYRLPDSTEEAAQLLLLAELSDAEFLNDVYRSDRGRAQVIVGIKDEGSIKTLPLMDRINAYIDSNPLPPDIEAELTGTVMLAQTVFAKLVSSLISSVAIAVIAIFALMAFMFRSIKIGLLALIPNAFPLLLMGAVMYAFGFDLKPTTVLVFAIAFGLVVDDTIHMLGRISALMKRGTDLDMAIETALHDSGRAILISSIVIGLGFSLVLLSGFEILFLVGLLTIVAIFGAIAADLVLLPALLQLAYRTRRA